MTADNIQIVEDGRIFRSQNVPKGLMTFKTCTTEGNVNAKIQNRLDQFGIFLLIVKLNGTNRDYLTISSFVFCIPKLTKIAILPYFNLLKPRSSFFLFKIIISSHNIINLGILWTSTSATEHDQQRPRLLLQHVFTYTKSRLLWYVHTSH